MQAEKTFTPNSALKTVTVFLVSTFILSASLHAEIINVPDDFETIQAAINEAEDSDTVLVQPGEYVENIDFEGRDIVVMGNPDDPSEVVIDGDENGSVVTFVNEETEAAELVGFTIQNGAVDGSGGGIHISNSSPTIRNCVIQGNQAGASGGGILVSQDCNPLITNCQIMDNISVDNGGGITVERHATPVIYNCLLVYNETDGNGGAIAAIDNASPVVLNCTFDWEGRWGWYTAIYLAASNVCVVNSIIYGPSPLWISFDPDSDESSIMIAYSDIQEGQESIVTNDNGEVQWEEGNIDEEPLFVDREEGDYYLTEDSPCVDAGDPDSDPDPDGTRADMGAYYFHQIGQYIDVPLDYETIQEAIDAAEDGDTVLVHPGVYVENISFEGKGITVASLILTTGDEAYTDSTIIDGDENGSVVTFNSDENEDAILTGFTIQNGYAQLGGGVFIREAGPTIDNLHIINNRSNRGGGIRCSYTEHILMTNLFIHDNSAGTGGGICIDSFSTITISNSLIKENRSDLGGGISCWGWNTIVLRNVKINDNGSGDGGGLYCRNRDNLVDLRNGEICGNSASRVGGGVFIEGTNVVLNKILIANNSCEQYVGGLYLRESQLELNNVTMYKNEAFAPIEILCFRETELTLVNTIIQCDSIDIYSNSDEGPNTVTVSYSNVGEIIVNEGDELNWGDGNIDEDPLFVDPDEGDYHLTEDSPCIDAGDPDSDPDPDGTRADMGAYYFHQIGRYIDVPLDYETIQEAIDASEDGDTVLVHPGTYVENISFGSETITVASLFLTTGDTAYVDSTIIDGDSSGSVVSFEYWSEDDSKLVGFTIRNGIGRGFELNCGGGIFCTDQDPYIIHCIIEDCSAQFGGGVFAFSIVDCPSPGPHLIDCIIRNNHAEEGGGVYLNARISEISGCTIVDNVATVSGGGVHFRFESSVEFENCTILNNSAGEAGGGIFGERSYCAIANLNISANTSGFQAGALYCSESQSDLSRSVLWGNQAGERCGGIVLDNESIMNVVNSTFTENWAGAVRCGIHARNSSQAVIANSIFWHNWPAQLCLGDGENNAFTVAYCDIEEGRDGIIGEGEVNWLDGNIDEDPLFVNPDEGNLDLAEGSPCIDAGTAFFVWEADTIINLTPEDYIGNAPDMGAFESEFTDVENSHVELPDEFRLYPVYPNPFNAATTLRFDLPREGDVYMAVYDLMGRKVAELLKGRLQAGRHSLIWCAGDLPSGLYLVEFALGNNVLHQKALLVK